MKRITKIIMAIIVLATICLSLSGCVKSKDNINSNDKVESDINTASDASANIISNQPAPNDLDYSLERYNLIRRAYWVNGQREKANSLVCEIEKPLGYITLLSDNGAVVGNFIVDGKVSSLGSYLFPAYIDCTSDGIRGSISQDNFLSSSGSVFSVEVAGIDGAYGSNVDGIFFFTTDGKYIEWTGTFLYSDIPFETDTPILTVANQ